MKIKLIIAGIASRFALIVAFSLVTGAFALTAYVIYKAQDPQARLESLLLDTNKRVNKALFSPDDNVKNVLIGLINAEKRRILCAIYMLTEKDIAQAFLEAQKRGVLLEFVVDRNYGADKFSRISELANNQVPIWVYQTSANERQASIMHDKFCIFEDTIAHKSLLWTGSYNFTKRASTTNQENALVIDNLDLIHQFTQQFEILKTRSLPISGNALGHSIPRHEHKEISYWWEPLWRLLVRGK